MTESPEKRMEQERDLLVALTIAVGDELFEVFDLCEPKFPGYLTTTWRALRDDGLIKSTREMRQDGPCYFLTWLGWRKGLEFSGRLDDPTFEGELVKIITAAKGRVKGRREDDVVVTDVLASEAGVTPELLVNVVTAELIEHKYQKKGLRFQTRNKQYIRIPLDFYM